MYVASWASPVLFEVAGIKIYSYGAFVAMALMACVLVLDMEIARLRIKSDAALMMLAFVPGFGIGSKGHMVVSALIAGEAMPSMSLESGHSFMGSAVGGMLSAAAYGKYCGVKPLVLIDLIAPLVPLGHAIGKIGCLLSGDGCYGPPAYKGYPLAMSFPNGGIPTKEFVHPTPLYECALSGSLFLFLHFGYYLPKKDQEKLHVGRRTALTLGLYGIVRLVIEPFRRHPADNMFGLTEYQFLAVIFVILGYVLAVIGRSMDPWPLDFGVEEEEEQKEKKGEKKKDK